MVVKKIFDQIFGCPPLAILPLAPHSKFRPGGGSKNRKFLIALYRLESCLNYEISILRPQKPTFGAFGAPRAPPAIPERVFLSPKAIY